MSWWEAQDLPAPWDRLAWDDFAGNLLGLELPVTTVPDLKLLVHTVIAIQRDCELTVPEQAVALAVGYMMPGVH